MSIRDFIKDHIPPLKETDTTGNALAWFNLFKTSHLPVLAAKKYLGLVSEKELLKAPDRNALLSTLELHHTNYFVYDSQYINDALQLVSNYKIGILPVINSRSEYAGLLTSIDLIECMAQSKSVRTPGGVIVLHIPVKNYSFAEISNIVESNEGVILSSAVEQLPDVSHYNVTIKINKLDLSRILAGFYRHDINVVAYYNHNDASGDIQDRYDSFMSYMNI